MSAVIDQEYLTAAEYFPWFYGEQERGDVSLNRRARAIADLGDGGREWMGELDYEAAAAELGIGPANE